MRECTLALKRYNTAYAFNIPTFVTNIFKKTDQIKLPDPKFQWALHPQNPQDP